MHLVSFRKVHISGHLPAVSLRPAAHTSERSDDCPSQSRQRILHRNGLRPRHAPSDQSCEFKIAKSSGQHPLGDPSEVAAQLPMSIGSVFQRKQNLGVHLPIKIGGTVFDSCSAFIRSCLLRKFPAGLFSRSAPSHVASPWAPSAIRNTCVPRPYYGLIGWDWYWAQFGGLGEQRPQASTAYPHRLVGRSRSDRDDGAMTS